MRIVYKNRHVVIIDKPAGMPAQSDPTGDADAMTETERALREANEPSSLWLVHRLDRPVRGLMVFARSKSAAAEISRIITEGGFDKRYLAVCRGCADGGLYRDFLYKDAKQNKAFVVDRKRAGVKEAELYAYPVSYTEKAGKGMTLLSVKLITGRFHQIRVQLASRKTPLIGDKKYGDTDKETRFPALISARITFTIFGSEISVSLPMPKDEYPWGFFEVNENELFE